MEVFSTAFLPPVSYIGRLLASKQPIVDLGENYIKQTIRNRAVVLSSNGHVNLIIPLRKSDSRTVADLEISYAEDWITRLIRTIRSSYKNSPYFEHYQEEFEQLVGLKEPLLHRYNRNMLDWVLKQLEIETNINYSLSYIELNETIDFRDYRPVELPVYKQVFSYKAGFANDISIIDLLFNKGPETMAYLRLL